MSTRRYSSPCSTTLLPHQSLCSLQEEEEAPEDDQDEDDQAAEEDEEDAAAAADAPEANEGDETLECRDCGAEFVFSVGEQEFYASKGFDNKPTRCKSCKDAKKAATSGGRDHGGGRGGRDFGGGAGVCYAFQRGECDRGSSCRFSHDGQGGGRGGGRGRGRGGFGGALKSI